MMTGTKVLSMNQHGANICVDIKNSASVSSTQRGKPIFWF
jgi:hypothetical protein